MTRRYIYDPMTREQFSQALDDLKLSARQFSRLCGAKEAYVIAWLEGKKDIPHNVLVICALLTLPGAMELALRVTNMVVHRADERGERIPDNET